MRKSSYTEGSQGKQRGIVLVKCKDAGCDKEVTKAGHFLCYSCWKKQNGDSTNNSNSKVKTPVFERKKMVKVVKQLPSVELTIAFFILGKGEEVDILKLELELIMGKH